VNASSIINFCYKIIFSWAIKPTAFHSEFGKVPVTFHTEVRKESKLPDADMQRTIYYTNNMYL